MSGVSESPYTPRENRNLSESDFGVGKLDLDRRGFPIAADTEACYLLGIEPPEENIETTQSPLDHQVAFLISFPELLRHALEEGVVSGAECPYRAENGKVRWVLINLQTLPDSQNGPVVQCILQDITRYKHAERELRLVAELERIIIAASLRFMRAVPETMARVTYETLEIIGECINADRAYVVLFGADGISIRESHEWHGRGVQPVTQTRRKRFRTDLTWVRGMLRERDMVHIPDVAQMPPEASQEQVLLHELGVRSTLILSLYDRSDLVGMAGFEAVGEPTHWSERITEALHAFTRVFENTVVRLPAFVALRESEERYRNLVESSHDAIFILSSQGRFQNANPGCTELLGYPRSQLVGMHVSSMFVHNADYRVLRNALIQRGDLSDQEVHLRHADGSTIVALLSISLRYSSQGELLGAHGVARDITKEKLAAAELEYRSQFERLMVDISNRFINLAPNDIDAAIDNAIKDLGKFAQADRCYILVLREEPPTRSSEGGQGDSGGYELEFDKDYEWCSPNTPSCKGEMASARFVDFPWASNRLLEDEPVFVPHIADLPPEAEAERGLMEARGYHSMVIVPIMCQGKLLGMLEFDSTSPNDSWSEELIGLLRVAGQAFGSAIERQRTEQERQNLEAQVRHSQKLESLGVLAGGIAHDFNNLLVGILGNAGLALMEIPEGHSSQGCLKQIEQAALRLSDLTNQMLAYSGKGHFLIESVNLSELTSEMLHLLRTAMSKRAVLKTDLAEEIPPVQADPTQVRQVVMNLITNASDAIESSSGVITIRTGADYATAEELNKAFRVGDLPPGHYAFIEVSDTGSGMDEETQARIFDPFFTTKFTGRGLGLAAVLGIIGGHKGAIIVDSKKGQGTTFRVLFPVAGEHATKPTVEETPVTEWRGSGTILVADDEDNVRRVTTAVLERFGLDVITAEDGRDAVEKFREQADSIDAVILDMTMPHMDGDEAFQEMRKIRPEVRVILTSGYTERETLNRLEEGHLAAFIQKPYSPLSLIQQLREILEAHNA